jgi:hypothetical protein
MKWFSAVLPFLVASPLLILSAIWQGKETERWGEIPEMKQFASRLEKLATDGLDIGPWHGTRAPGLTESLRKESGAEGDLRIVYENKLNGEHVEMFIVVGRLLDMSKHRPDRCYPAQGYKAVGEEAVLQKVTTDAGSKAEFRTALYYKDDVGNTRIYWSWASDNVWKGPDGEDGLRQVFRRTKPIYKMYVSNLVRADAGHAGAEPSIDLIKALVPVYNKILFPATDESVTGSSPPAKANATKAPVPAKSAND